ncbi:glycosyltransferase family 2 protein [Shewanella intestini]|uniref:Glycosyltransferase family 2 protein n=1 Tax=Shewanella intestini TaxID=2017544 RepID=A0ABS5I1W1_9GAMM|nr:MULTISPECIES: glycosyltransferase [Shewanella]MBR9728010.1 glycosyltransferase family 2 protein [Shewanella intestini]MRG36439.1 glycosyltransferase [Shewanella sp. XMDDZSB0408]
MSHSKVSFVLTSCNRFDLLEETLKSFLKFNTYPIAQYIIIEDSHNIDKLNQVLNKFPQIEFTVLHNIPQLGQMKSIDKAYAEVTSEYIFHCEDDWEFYREGFIEESFNVLNADNKIVTVWLREQNDTNGHPVEPEIYTCEDEAQTPYQLIMRNYKQPGNGSIWHGFTFNPGLRRLADYNIFAPIGNLGRERDMSQLYYDKGFKAAIFPTGFVRHIGYHRGIRYKLGQSNLIKDFSVKMKKVKAKICQVFETK